MYHLHLTLLLFTVLHIHRQFETYFISVSIPFLSVYRLHHHHPLLMFLRYMQVGIIHILGIILYMGLYTTLDILVTLNSMLPLLLDKFVTVLSIITL